MPLPFVKLVAAGNVYLAVDGRSEARDWSHVARAMGKPHFGGGSDGRLGAVPSERAPIGLRIWNSDGSEAEMSGNGVRLFAKFALEARLAEVGAAEVGVNGLPIETKAGLRTVWPEWRHGRIVGGRVGMGVPEHVKRSVSLNVGGHNLAVTCLSLGNPHAVHLADVPVADFPLAEIGPGVEHHPEFPNRVNFEVVNVLDRNRLRVRVFERGEGETQSSGTGA